MTDPKQLIDAYIDGALDDAGFAALSDWLREDAANRRAFTRALSLHSGIADWAADHSGGLLMPELTADDSSAGGVDWVEAVAALSDDHDEIEPVDLTDELARRERQAKEKSWHARRRAQQQQAIAEQSRPFVISKTAVVFATAAVLGLIAWLGWPDTQPADSTDSSSRTAQQGDPGVSRAVAPATNVALIRSSVDARWVGLAYNHNHYLRGGKTVTLRAGLAEVVFGDGAAVIIQGPATFEPTGPNAMRLDTGRIVATVPDSAHGFTVDTAGGLITDYGTEFGVHVNTDGQTLAQTYSGRIGLTPEGGEEIDLLSGDAVVADTRGRVREVEAKDLAFVRQAEFTALAQAESSRRARWLASTFALKRDPSLVAMYLFDSENEPQGTLANAAPRTLGALDGTFAGDGRSPSWVEGRWAGDLALAFDASRRQRVVIDDWLQHAPGQAMTLSVWFRADTNREDWNIVVSQWGSVLGPDCRFHLGVVGSLSDGNAPAGDRRVCLHVFSEGDQLFKDQARSGGSMVGQTGWVHAAFTVTAQGEARLYINGQEVDHTRVEYNEPSLAGSRLPLVLGGKSVGDLFFDGAIDELVVLSRAMTPDEIAQQYEVGNPTPGAR